MRKLITRCAAAMVIMVGGLVAAQEISGYTRLFNETQILTRLAPTEATEGMSLDNIFAYRISVCTASGQTLTSGSLAMYVYDTDRALWLRSPGGDETITVTAGSQRCQNFPDRLVGPSIGRMLPACASVVVSSGTTCNVQIKAFTRRGYSQGR